MRAFLETSQLYGGKMRRVAQIACKECKKTEETNLVNGAGIPIPETALEKKYEQRGWIIGRNPAHDICPECAKKEKKIMLKVVKDAEAAIAAEPRQMVLEDRRIIFAKLNEVYIDEKRGYDSNWSDRKVAEDLNVPRQWVETIRAENFGPIAINPEIQEYITQSDQLSALMKELVADEKKARDAFEKRLAEIHSRTVRLEKMATEVRKLVVIP